MITSDARLRGVVFGFVLLGLLSFAPAARADYWQKSSDGYWYYWSDNDQRWYWLDGKDWFYQQDGNWVKWTPQTPRYIHYWYPAPSGPVSFPYGHVSWGAGGQVVFPYGQVSWGPGGGYVVFPFGSVSWPGRGWRHLRSQP